MGPSNFENKITSREDMLITETEDVLKEIYNFMGIGEQIPLISSKELPHWTGEIERGWPSSSYLIEN